MAVSDAELAILITAKDKASGTIDKVGGKLGKFGGAAKVAKLALIGIGVGALAAAAGLFKIGADFDKAFDTIRVGTGATGDAFKGLQKDFKSVFKSIPTDMASAADAITQFNTLTGATGPALQNMAKSGLEAARLLGEDSSALIGAAGKAFNVFEIGADAASGVLDAVFTASQKSNVPMTKLLSTLQTYGPVLKNLGFGIAKSTAFFASLEKAGIDVSRVMPGLNAFMRKLSDEGVTDLSAALDDQIEKIKGAKTESEALNLATQAFGAEGAQRLSVAIRTGALDLKEFTAALVDSEGNILSTAKETESLGEKFTRFKNTVLVAIQPLATGFFDGLTKVATLIEEKVIPQVSLFINLFRGGLEGEGITSKGFHGRLEAFGVLVRKIIKGAIPIVESIRAAFIQFGRDALPHLIEFAELLIDIGRVALPIVFDAIETLLAGWKQLFVKFIQPIVLPLLRKLGKFLLDNKIILVALGAILAVALVGPILLVIAALILLLAKWDEIKAVFTKTIPAAIDSVITKIEELPIIGAIFTDTMNTIRIIVTTVFEVIKNRIETAIKAIQAIIKIVLALIKGDFGAAWRGIKELVSVLINGIKTEIGLILGGIAGLVKSKLQAAADIIPTLTTAFISAAFSLGSALAEGIADGFETGLFFIKVAINSMISIVQGGINLIIGAWNSLEFNLSDPTGILGRLGFPSGVSIGTPDLPLVSIPRLQAGAFVPPGVVTPAILHGGRFGEEVRPLGSSPSRAITVNIFDRAAATRRQARQIARDVAEHIENDRLLA